MLGCRNESLVENPEVSERIHNKRRGVFGRAVYGAARQ